MAKPILCTRNFRTILIMLIGMLSISLPLHSQFYTGLQTPFGKNRVQYDDERSWSYFRYKKYDVYFYQGGLAIAKYSTTYIHEQLEAISKKLDYSMKKKIRFIFFNDLSDLKETNIGLITDEQYNTGGVIHIVDNKVFIAFNGNHRDLETEIRKGIAQVMINELMYGGSAGNAIKSSILLSFPSWYIDGLVHYMAEGWNVDVDNIVRDGILSGRYKKFNRLNREQQAYVGQSIWHYIDERYGRKAIGEVLYMAKVNRNIETGFLYVLGMSYKMLLKDWYDWYQKRYEFDTGAGATVPELSILKKRRNKSKRVYSRPTISQDGRYVAYVRNEIGKVKVRILDLQKGRRKTIMKFGYKLDEKTDYTYPLIAWSPMDNSLTLIHEKAGNNELIVYNEKGRKRLKRYLLQFDKVLDFSYNKRGNMLVMSAVRHGRSDIYLYNIGSNTFKRITNDVYDDEYPRFVNNGTAIIFSSNRPDDIIRFDKATNKNVIIDTLRGMPNNDLFYYEIKPNNMKLRRVTNTPLYNEIYPMPISYNHFSWLSDENGIYNRFVGRFDSTISFVDTVTHYRYYTKYHAASNYAYNILEQDYNTIAGKFTELVYKHGHYRMFVHDLPEYEDYEHYELSNTSYMSELKYAEKLRQQRIEKMKHLQRKMANDSTLRDSIAEKKKPIKKKHFQVIYLNKNNNKQTQQNNTGIDINNYRFEGETEESAAAAQQNNNANAQAATQMKKTEPKPNIDIFKPKMYYVEYSVSQIVTQMDFSYLDYSYQPFTNPRSPIYINPGFNAFIKLGVADLFEDYHLTGGVRLSANLKNNEYLASFKNLKKRLDKEYVFHHKVLTEYQYDYGVKHQIHEAMLNLSWPFDQVKSLRGSVFFRYDNAAYLSQSQYANIAKKTLQKPNDISYNAGLRMSYVYDNTRTPGINLFYGTRYKIFAEYYQPINEWSDNMIVVGLDFRKYIKLFKTFIWANRVAASSSFGTQRLAYYMGGVDNWMFPKFNQFIQVDPNQNFRYQTLATNMRGFNQNIRNGNNFVVINSELRLPVFQVISNKPVGSQFLRNFMAVGFFDVGTAWSGPNPFSDNNALFRQEIYNYPIKVTIINQNDPVVAGFGFGFRTKIFGYYVRTDWAWGIENGYVRDKAVFYLSLSLDF